jgi:outer membrane autotransporter protein
MTIFAEIRSPGPASYRRALLASVACLTGLMPLASANAQDLSSYAVLAGSTITNTGPTTITGNIGLSPGTSFTGQGSVTIDGEVHVADAVAVRAKSDLTSAFNVLMGLTPTAPPMSGDLGGQTLSAGVYSFAETAGLTGTLTLQGNEDDIFVIQVGSSLTTASNSSILLSGTVSPSNVFFVVGESATLGTSSTFVGQILAGASITLETTAKIECGAALAQTGAVTLDTNTISVCTFTTSAEDLEDILGDEITGNSGSITDAIDEYITNGGTLPLSFQLLELLSPTELAEALEQLSGELGTEVAPAGQQGMDSFLDLLGGPHGDSRELLTSYDQPTAGGTVSVMGYAAASAPVGGSAFDGFDAAVQPQRDGEWTTWISGYGSKARTEGDADTGSHTATSSAYGVALGFERDVGPNTMVGVAVSTGGTSFELGDDLGSGKSAMLQAALYARASFENAYIAAAAAAGYHRVSLDRTLTFAGTDHFTAEFDATNFAAEIEAGYDLGWLTPYVALRGQAFSTPAYSEVTESGASTFALDYDAGVATSLRTELGARADWTTDLDDDGSLNLYASAAWAHTIRSGYNSVASFQMVPGTSFNTTGATPAADSLLAEAGAEYTTSTGMTLGTSVKGEFSENVLNYGGTASLSYHW